jgi:hypothetical protein
MNKPWHQDIAEQTICKIWESRNQNHIVLYCGKTSSQFNLYAREIKINEETWLSNEELYKNVLYCRKTSSQFNLYAREIKINEETWLSNEELYKKNSW